MFLGPKTPFTAPENMGHVVGWKAAAEACQTRARRALCVTAGRLEPRLTVILGRVCHLGLLRSDVLRFHRRGAFDSR